MPRVRTQPKKATASYLKPDGKTGILQRGLGFFTGPLGMMMQLVSMSEMMGWGASMADGFAKTDGRKKWLAKPASWVAKALGFLPNMLRTSATDVMNKLDDRAVKKGTAITQPVAQPVSVAAMATQPVAVGAATAVATAPKPEPIVAGAASDLVPPSTYAEGATSEWRPARKTRLTQGIDDGLTLVADKVGGLVETYSDKTNKLAKAKDEMNAFEARMEKSAEKVKDKLRAPMGKIDYAKHSLGLSNNAEKLDAQAQWRAEMMVNSARDAKGDIVLEKYAEALTKGSATEDRKTGLSQGSQSKILDYAKKTKEERQIYEAEINYRKNPKQAIEHRLKNMTVADAVSTGYRVFAIASEGVSRFKSFRESLRALKQLTADMQGVSPKSISTWKLLFGKQTGMVKEARSQFFKGAVPGVGIFFASTMLEGFAHKKISQKFGYGSIAATMGSQMLFSQVQSLGGHLEQQNSFLEYYSAYRAAQAEGKQLGAQDYKDLAGSVITKMPVAKKLDSYGMTLIAQYYAINQTPLEQVMKDMNGGSKVLLERVEQGRAAMKEIQEQQAAAEAASDQAPLTQGTGQHTGQARNQPMGAAGGSFTDRILAEQAAGAGQQQAAAY